MSERWIRLSIGVGVLMAPAIAAYLVGGANAGRERQRAAAMLAARPAARPELTAYFSPRGGCTDALVDLIGSARHSVRVQAYSFTSRPIAEALAAARRRGVDVSVLLDEGQRKSPHSLGGYCREAGIPVAYDGAHAIAHNKVMVVDGKAVATGSYNFTAAAEASNAENVLIVRDGDLAAKYLANWGRHREHSEAAVAGDARRREAPE